MARSSLAAGLIGVVLATALTACGSDDESTSSGGSGGQAGAGGGQSTIAPGMRWIGRVDLSAPEAPRFAWSGTGFAATVSGSEISVRLATEGSSDPVFYQPVVDGVPAARFSIPNGEQTIELATGLSADEHLVEVYRETEGRYGSSVFLGFASGTLGEPPAEPGRLIEIGGDSISAGYGNLGSEEHPDYGPDPTGGCDFTTDTESAYLTYGTVAGRALGADVSIIASSGWGVYRDYSGGTVNVMPSIYENTLGSQATPAWPFGAQPQAVVINLGTNDFAQGDPGEAEFTGAYSAFLATVRGRYPEAFIFCAVGPLLWGDGLTQATQYIHSIVDAANAAGDDRVVFLDFGQQNTSLGTGCAYHPNVPEHQRLADILVPAVQANLSW
jgi:hypothetical protein